MLKKRAMKGILTMVSIDPSKWISKESILAASNVAADLQSLKSLYGTLEKSFIYLLFF